MSAMDTLRTTKTLTVGAPLGHMASSVGVDMLKDKATSAANAAAAPGLARDAASKITETDIANQRRARIMEANMRGVPAQTIGRGAATLFSPQAGTSATKTLLGQ